MNELKSYTEYAVSTPTADFVIGFDFNYVEDAVNVTVDDVPATEAGYTVVYLNETTIQLSPSVPSGVVRLQRETDIDQTDHAYRAGAKFIAQTMDENFEQLRHSQQEVRDGFNKLADDTYEIINTLQEVGQSAQDAADAAEVAAGLANDAAAQVSAKLSKSEIRKGALDWKLADTPYNIGYRAVLSNGDIVKSTVDGNANDPNVDMAGWVFDKNSFYIVNSKDDLTSDLYLISRGKAETLSYHAGLGRGGAKYIYDQTKSLINNGITIINGWVLQWDGKNLDLLQSGCYGDGDSITPHDDGVKIGQCLDILYALGGGSLQGRGRTYLNETTNYEINTDNIFVVLAKFKRVTTKNGWMFQTATTKEISGGGFISVEGKGSNTVVAGSAFINMGTNTYKHNRYVLRDIVSDGWSQYGIGILGGDHWYAENIKVLNHGLATGSMSACMGFYVYPRNAGGSKGGLLNGVYSEMSAAAIANASLNSAAVKLQTHQLANFSNITAIGGFEQCLGIDSIDGNIKDVLVYPQGERPGLVLGNYNTAHAFSGQKFTLNGFRVTDAVGSSGTNAMLIGAGEDGQYKLNGCSIRNGTARRFKSLTLTAYKDCTFENIKCEDIRLSSSFQSLTNNSALSTGNTFINVRATAAVFAIETHDSEITDSGNAQKVTATGSVILGNGNIFKSFTGSADTNPLAIRGNNNTFIDPILKGVTRAAWFQTGTMGNKIIAPTYLNSSAVLNSGDTTNKVEFVKATGLTSASTAANIVSALQSAGLAT